MKIPCFFSTAALLAVFSSGVSPSLSAEERKPVTESNYTLAERFTPAKVSRMVHSMTVVPRWIDGTDSFWYSYETSDGTFWWIVDCRKGTGMPRQIHYAMDNHTQTNILFVCLGNICRSSAAEGIMRRLVEEAGLSARFAIDSAGILSYHRGELPDSRMRAHAARRGYRLVHRSRPVCTDDFYRFDLIIGMDDRTSTTCGSWLPRPRSGRRYTA